MQKGHLAHSSPLCCAIVLRKRIHLNVNTIGLKPKVMLQKTIHNDDFWCNEALQHCCSDIVSNGYNIVPTVQPGVALKIVVANHLA